MRLLLLVHFRLNSTVRKQRGYHTSIASWHRSMARLYTVAVKYERGRWGEEWEIKERWRSVRGRKRVMEGGNQDGRMGWEQRGPSWYNRARPAPAERQGVASLTSRPGSARSAGVPHQAADCRLEFFILLLTDHQCDLNRRHLVLSSKFFNLTLSLSPLSLQKYR